MQLAHAVAAPAPVLVQLHLTLLSESVQVVLRAVEEWVRLELVLQDDNSVSVVLTTGIIPVAGGSANHESAEDVAGVPTAGALCSRQEKEEQEEQSALLKQRAALMHDNWRLQCLVRQVRCCDGHSWVLQGVLIGADNTFLSQDCAAVLDNVAQS